MASRVRSASCTPSCLVNTSPLVLTTLCVSIDSSTPSSTPSKPASVAKAYYKARGIAERSTNGKYMAILVGADLVFGQQPRESTSHRRCAGVGWDGRSLRVGESMSATRVGDSRNTWGSWSLTPVTHEPSEVSMTSLQTIFHITSMIEAMGKFMRGIREFKSVPGT